MAAKKIAPVALLMLLMGGAGFWALQMIEQVEGGEDEVTPAERPQPAPVRVEASKRGGALSKFSREPSAGGESSADAGDDAGAPVVLKEGARGGALAGISRRRKAERAQADAGPDGSQEDWSEGPREAVGPSRWMRERLNDEEAGELRDDLESGEMEQARTLAMREDRQRSIHAVEARVQDCFAELVALEPERTGRLGLTWTMLAGGGVGLVTDPQVRANMGLREPGFEACIAGSLQGVEFEATGESEILVEWAFMP